MYEALGFTHGGGRFRSWCCLRPCLKQSGKLNGKGKGNSWIDGSGVGVMVVLHNVYKLNTVNRHLQYSYMKRHVTRLPS